MSLTPEQKVLGHKYKHAGEIHSFPIVATPEQKYTCGNCYNEFPLPVDMRCPSCKVREIVPMPRPKLATPEQIDEIRKVLKEATPGPWTSGKRLKGYGITGGNVFFEQVASGLRWEDAQLIVLLRNNAQQLLDTVEAYKTEMSRYIAINDQLQDDCNQFEESRDVWKSDYGTAQQQIAELEDKVDVQAKEIERLNTTVSQWDKCYQDLVTAENETMQLRAEVERLTAENKQLQHRDRVVSLTNETLGRYVRERDEIISQLRAEEIK